MAPAIGATSATRSTLRFEYEKFELEGLDDADVAVADRRVAILMNWLEQEPGPPRVSAPASRRA
jgi:hypothetical protein